MMIAKRVTLDEFRSETWEEFAKDMGAGVPHTRRCVRELAEAIANHGPQVAAMLAESGLDDTVLSGYVSIA